MSLLECECTSGCRRVSASFAAPLTMVSSIHAKGGGQSLGCLWNLVYEPKMNRIRETGDNS